MNGIRSGFDIIEKGANLNDVYVQNHKSAMSVRESMDSIILNEIREGNYVITDTKPTIVSALGAVPKSDGGFRQIHDCSLPIETGLNSYAPTFCHYAYESVDDAVRLMGPHFYMAKIDIYHAYRHVSISKDSQRATGLQWTFLNGRSVFMIDRKMPYGARGPPIIFHRISQAIKRMMARRGYKNIVAYQDDFLVIGSNYEECYQVWTIMQTLLKSLGFKINEKKLVPPTTCLVFLGIQIDTVACELSLPADKLSVIQDCVASFMSKKRATKQQLQSLVGRLNFAARVVRGARLFLRRLFNAIATLKHQRHKFRLRGPVKADIEWWHRFLRDFNGVAAFMDNTPITTVQTDACLRAGGAFYRGDFYYTSWEADYPEAADMCINYKEALIAVLALQRWGHLFANKYVFLYTDNQCAATILNKCSCKNDYLMQCMRDMFWLSTKYNFCVKVFYMQGCLQTLPDAISRLHENGGLLKVQSLINDWYLCHAMYTKLFMSFNLLNHMSVYSLLCILDQVMAWRKVKFR